MWSVVHLPSTLRRTLVDNSSPDHGWNGSNNCNSSDSGDTLTSTSELVSSFKESLRGQFFTSWGSESERFTVFKRNSVGHRVEVHVTRVNHGGDHVWRSQEVHGVSVTVVSSSEVSVERSENSVVFSRGLGNISSVPSTDTWTTSVGQHDSTVLLEGVNKAITFNGGSDLFRTWGDEEWNFWFKTSVFSLLDNGSSTRHVLIVAIPVQDKVLTPSPKYSTINPVPPSTVKTPANLVITSFGEDQPDNWPVNLTPKTFGAFNSHGVPVRASTASAPPTPIAIAPKPPALGVWESVPNIIKPGVEKFSKTIW